MKSSINGYFLLACESPATLMKLPVTCCSARHLGPHYVNLLGHLWLSLTMKKRAKPDMRWPIHRHDVFSLQ